MKYILAAITLTALFACKNAEEASISGPMNEPQITADIDTVHVDTTEMQKPQRPYDVTAEIGDLNRKSDHYEILDAYFADNHLMIDIKYTGGCGWHKYEFVGSPAVMKSNPPQRMVKLIHDDGDDNCESEVIQTIRVDVRPLTMTATVGSEIILILDGYKEKLKYIYQ